MPNPPRILACLVLGAGLVACGGDERATATQDERAPPSLWGALGTVSYEFPVYGTVQDILEASDLAVVGDVVDVRPGRTLGSADTPDAVATSHLVIEVERVLQGRPGRRPQPVILEMTTPLREDAASLAAIAVEKEPSIFLLTAIGGPDLHGPTSADGIVVANAPGVSFPLVDGENTALTEAARGLSLPEVAARIAG